MNFFLGGLDLFLLSHIGPSIREKNSIVLFDRIIESESIEVIEEEEEPNFIELTLYIYVGSHQLRRRAPIAFFKVRGIHCL